MHTDAHARANGNTIARTEGGHANARLSESVIPGSRKLLSHPERALLHRYTVKREYLPPFAGIGRSYLDGEPGAMSENFCEASTASRYATAVVVVVMVVVRSQDSG